MAVRKPEPTGSTVEAATSAYASTRTSATQVSAQATRDGRDRQTVADDSSSITRSLNLGLLRSGAVLLAGFEIAYFILERFVPPPLTHATIALHASAVGVPVLALALTTSDWFERHWRAVCFANLLAIYGLTVALRLLTGKAEPLFMTLVLTLVGAGALLPWSARWQLGLSAVALPMAIVPDPMLASAGQQATYRSLEVVMAVILGHFILAMREHYRAELVAWMNRLRASRQELAGAHDTALAASEAKSHFLSVMSHEIRTPMNAILGMADLLWETPLSAEQRRYLETMRNNGTLLLNLVNGILDLSRVESGLLNLERVDFDLADLAEDVMETMAVRAHEKGLELALRIAPASSTALTGDPLRLRQILINLLGNAIKFTEHGEVTLTIEAADTAQGTDALAAPPTLEDATVAADAQDSMVKRQRLRFAVHDTGIGIPADQQQAIFSNFIQADSTVSRKYGGSGLGLAIVKRLVELMRGEMRVESRPCEGSTFSFTVALELQSAATARPSIPAGSPSLAGKRVLVVDDSPASRTIVAELLELAGAEVAVAADGRGALDELARARAAGQPYDAVVADNRMPAPDGAAIAQRLMAASNAPREALVLMLTANDFRSQLARLRDSGLEEGPRCRYLRKPVRRRELWAALEAVCAGADDYYTHRNGTDGAAATGRPAELDTAIHRAASRGAATPSAMPLSILLAEDSFDNGLLVEAYLKNTSYRIDRAENGEVAVHKFATGHYDVILMDIQMPVMDGYEAAAEIRRLERADHRRPTPIIALTASAQDEAVRRSSKMGFNAHLIKPVKRATMLEAIRDAVEKPAAPSAGQPDDDQAADTAGAASIVVHIDQELSDLIPGFLARKRQDASALMAAVERGDSETVARLGHKMKGEGGSYGLDTITDLGRELEQAGKDGDFDSARRLGRDLTNFLERLDIVYRPMEE